MTKEEIEAIKNHISNIPAVAGMYVPVMLAWLEKLIDERDRLTQGAKDETAQWYVIDPENGVEIHATAEEAQADAEACLEHLRDCSVDGWHEDVQSLQWGRLVPYQWTCQTDLREAPEGSDHDYLCDYVLTTVK